MRAGVPLLALCFSCLAAHASEEKLRYDFESKKAGGKAVPHSILAGEWKEFENPGSPKGDEIGDVSYQRVANDEDKHAGAESNQKGKAALLVIFQLEKAVHAEVERWRRLELDLSAVAGASGSETGPGLVVEAWRSAEKQWVALENDRPEGWDHHYAPTGPWTAFPDRDGRLAFRLSAKEPPAGSRVVLDHARLTLVVETGNPKDPLTQVSLAAECRLTRPDDPLWHFDDSDDWAIVLRKGEGANFTLRIKRFDGNKKYKFGDDVTLPGDNVKGIAEAVLASQMQGFSTRDEVTIEKGALGPHKTLEWAFVGELRKDKRVRALRDIFIKEKRYTYRISINGYSEWITRDRGEVERALKTFRIDAE